MIACVWLPYVAAEMSFRDRVASRRRPLLLCDSTSGEVLARCARSSRVAIGAALHTALASVPDAVVLPSTKA